jgi:hypothetical protein
MKIAVQFVHRFGVVHIFVMTFRIRLIPTPWNIFNREILEWWTITGTMCACQPWTWYIPWVVTYGVVTGDGGLMISGTIPSFVDGISSCLYTIPRFLFYPCGGFSQSCLPFMQTMNSNDWVPRYNIDFSIEFFFLCISNSACVEGLRKWNIHLVCLS